ncbi:MAG: type II toxin-antitoxin system VapC family toxin [Stellaceae bacterium]|jgi:ribonuclease VapC
MIIDTSAVVAVLFEEPEMPAFAQAMEDAVNCRMSAANFLEATIVIDGWRDPVVSRRLDDLINAVGIAIEPFDEVQARLARAAYQDFGKGSGHPARLNFGDCFAYALARQRGEPLLFKGNDFIHTDITPALP